MRATIYEMSIIEWTFAATVLSRFISLRRQTKRGEPSRINVSGGEISKFIITFFLLYLWNAFWFTILS